uniref:Uncharacterized protein n=1 Tax=Scleropages formosus TaxID=113540 RepID=A0A8C9S9E9_SCLFO
MLDTLPVMSHSSIYYCCPAAQHHKRVSYLISLAWGKKNQNSKLEVRFLLNAYRYRTIVKSKNCELDHCNSGTVL